MKVLVADDNADVREVLSTFLTSRGVEVLAASDGMETMRHVTRCRLHGLELDGLVLDIWMPRLGGINGLRRIRELHPAVAVIVTTGSIEPSLHRQAQALGARAVLTKPIDVAECWQYLLSDHAPSHEIAPPRHSEAVEPRPVSTTSTRVLVVDDDADLREVLVEFLESRGYEALTAPDGLSAVKVLAEETVDVILLDVNMPGLCGTDALPTIRALTPRTPVIMVTANIDREVARRTLAYGAFDYLVKPINWGHLTQSLKLALESRTIDAEIPMGPRAVR
jgi:two-component system, sensor histidine kinase and response regulator